MKRWRVIFDFAAFVLLAAPLTIIVRLPPRWVFAAARLAGRVFHWGARSRRAIVRRNLDIAFRDAMPPQEKRSIAGQCFVHAAENMASFLVADRLIERLPRGELFRLDSEAEAILSRTRGRAAAFLSAHVGDWEMVHQFLVARGIQPVVIVRDLSNPLINRAVRRIRERRGSRLVDKRGALRSIHASLRDARSVGILADQNSPHRRTFLRFCGTPASTYTEYARVLVRAGCPVVFVACLSEGAARPRGGYRVVVRELRAGQDVERAQPRNVVEAQATGLVERYLGVVEELLRAYPEQYFWLHRRWKSRPTGAPWLYHDLDHPLDLRLLDAPADTGNTGRPKETSYDDAV